MSKKSSKKTQDSTEECFESQLTLLRLHGVWPPKNSNHKIELPHLIWRLIRNCSVTFVLNCAVIHMAMKFTLGTDESVTDDLIGISASLFFVYIFFMFYLNQNKIIRFAKLLRDYREYGKPDGFEALIKKQKTYTYAIYIYCQIGALIYGCVSYFFTFDCKETGHVNASTCGMILPMYIPFKISKQAKLGIVIAQLVIIVHQVLLPGFIGSYFMVAIMEHMALRIRHIRMTISTLPGLKSYKERRKTLIYCISYHTSIIRYEKMFSECFGSANAVHLFLSGFIVGILNYKIYYQLEVKDITHLFGWMSCLMLVCLVGQTLLNESTALSTEIYLLPWYKFEKPLQDMIKMFIMRAQKPIKVEAAIFYSYSNEFLLLVFRSSFSYMAILNQFTNRTNAKVTSGETPSN